MNPEDGEFCKVETETFIAIFFPIFSHIPNQLNFEFSTHLEKSMDQHYHCAVFI